MGTVILVRHGRTAANATGVLAGRLPGVALDEMGQAHVAKLAGHLAVVPLTTVVTSPLERCVETAQAIASLQPTETAVQPEPDLLECDYGSWQGQRLHDLMLEPLWSVVQREPSSVVFPEGEGMLAMRDRAVAAIRRHDDRLSAEHGPNVIWAAVSHGDLIKAIVADALEMPFNSFQRLRINPASISVVTYRDASSTVLTTNATGEDARWLAQASTVAEEVGGGNPE